MSPEPCDCPPAYRRSDCRAGREACRAFAPDAVPLFNSTRPAWIAGRWLVALGLACGLAGLALAVSGCGPKRLGPAEMYRDPIGAEYIDGSWYCVDSRGTKWLSRGECD